MPTMPRATGRARRGLLFLATLASIAAGLGAAPIRAQTANVPPILAGTWQHDGALARSVRTIDAAFAPSLAVIPELLQGFARDRIRTDMAPPRSVDVTLEGGRVRVALHAEREATIEGALNSHARTTGVDEGTVVTPRVASGWLELQYVGEGSELLQLLSTEADGGHMHLDYTVTSPRLRGPVRYRLEYVRAAGH
ncbi:MAG: hypothetical protein U0234_21680 [Sandaracinus sp.]